MVVLNFWLVVFLVDKILARGGSWWFVVARGGSWWPVVVRGGSWWFVVVRGGSCVVLDLTAEISGVRLKLLHFVGAYF